MNLAFSIAALELWMSTMVKVVRCSWICSIFSSSSSKSSEPSSRSSSESKKALRSMIACFSDTYMASLVFLSMVYPCQSEWKRKLVRSRPLT